MIGGEKTAAFSGTSLVVPQTQKDNTAPIIELSRQRYAVIERASRHLSKLNRDKLNSKNCSRYSNKHLKTFPINLIKPPRAPHTPLQAVRAPLSQDIDLHVQNQSPEPKKRRRLRTRRRKTQNQPQIQPQQQGQQATIQQPTIKQRTCHRSPPNTRPAEQTPTLHDNNTIHLR